MEYHEFLGQVQHRARLSSFEEATRATRAALETLGERLFGGEAGNLAAHLPPELGRYLLVTIEKESFGVDEYFLRVSAREGVDLPEAIFHARMVLEVLTEAVSATLMAKAKAQLPSEYDKLFYKAKGAGGAH